MGEIPPPIPESEIKNFPAHNKVPVWQRVPDQEPIAKLTLSERKSPLQEFNDQVRSLASRLSTLRDQARVRIGADASMKRSVSQLFEETSDRFAVEHIEIGLPTRMKDGSSVKLNLTSKSPGWDPEILETYQRSGKFDWVKYTVGTAFQHKIRVGEYKADEYEVELTARKPQDAEYEHYKIAFGQTGAYPPLPNPDKLYIVTNHILPELVLPKDLYGYKFIYSFTEVELATGNVKIYGYYNPLNSHGADITENYVLDNDLLIGRGRQSSFKIFTRYVVDRMTSALEQGNA